MTPPPMHTTFFVSGSIAFTLSVSAIFLIVTTCGLSAPFIGGTKHLAPREYMSLSYLNVPLSHDTSRFAVSMETTLVSYETYTLFSSYHSGPSISSWPPSKSESRAFVSIGLLYGKYFSSVMIVMPAVAFLSRIAFAAL